MDVADNEVPPGPVLRETPPGSIRHHLSPNRARTLARSALGIDARPGCGHRQVHVDPTAVSQNPELLERLHGLDSRWRESHVASHVSRPVRVETEMTEVLARTPIVTPRRAGSLPGDRCPTEIQGVVRSIPHHLDHIRVEHGIHRRDDLAKGGHDRIRTRREVQGDLTDESRREQRLVGLHVDHDCIVVECEPIDDLGDSLGSGSMGGRGAARLRLRNPRPPPVRRQRPRSLDPPRSRTPARRRAAPSAFPRFREAPSPAAASRRAGRE